MFRQIIALAVCVSVSIRTGFVADLEVFGFAASDVLRDAKSENIALRDQRLALECEFLDSGALLFLAHGYGFTRG